MINKGYLAIPKSKKTKINEVMSKNTGVARLKGLPFAKDGTMWHQKE